MIMERRLSKLEEMVFTQALSNPSKSILKRSNSPHRLSISLSRPLDGAHAERPTRMSMGNIRARNSIFLSPPSPFGNEKPSRRNSTTKSSLLSVSKTNSRLLKKRNSAVNSFFRDPSLAELSSSSSTMLFDKGHSSNASVYGFNSRFSTADEEKIAMRRANLRARFQRAVRKLLLILRIPMIGNYIATRRLSRAKLKSKTNESDKEIKLEEIRQGPLFFDKGFFSRSKEASFPDEAKKYLNLPFHERTPDMLRYIVSSLKFCMPEFSEFPVFMHRLIAQYARYEEFEPGRILIRQGHWAHNYYIIISGLAEAVMASINGERINGELVFNPVCFLKRGDSFGDMALINNSRRGATITTAGNRPLCLLVVSKEEFFLIQTPVATKEEKLKFLEDSVGIFKHIEYPIRQLNEKDKACFTIFYRAGTIICENIENDDWLYVVKKGACRVLKKICINQETREFYDKHLTGNQNNEMLTEILIDFYMKNRANRTVQDYERFDRLLARFEENRLDFELARKSDFPRPKTADKVTYMLVHRLREGDMFGIHNLAFIDDHQRMSGLVLVSDGIEMVLINRKYFVDFLPSNSMLKLKYALRPYPDDKHYIKKYYSQLDWASKHRKLL